MSFLLALLLQVGPNPAVTDPLGVPEELANRPARNTAIAAPQSPTSKWLAECLDQLDQDPARAHTKAQIRRNDTSGPDRVVANHCLGLAATQLGLWHDATAAFLAARDETPVIEASAKARFAAMAGNAALAGDDTATALATLAEARELARAANSATLEAIAATDHARALVNAGREDEALEALELATGIEPGMVDGWLYRATLLRRLDRIEEAEAAIRQGRALGPNHIEIALEAGVIAAMQGRGTDARDRWEQVITLEPESVAAQQARTYLIQLGPEPAADRIE